MALNNEIGKLLNSITTAEQIKEKIKTTAENSGVTVENDDTPLSVLDKIGSELPSGENYAEWEAVNTQLEENIGDYANTPQKTLAQKIIDKSVTEITEWDLEGITQIGDYVFSFCSYLYRISLPNKDIYINTGAFSSYGSYVRNKIEDVIIPEKIKFIGRQQFSASSVKKVIFEGTRETLSEYMFNNCNFIETIILPQGLVRIPNYFCQFAYLINGIDIPESVTQIGDSAFRGCDFSNITIPSGVISIGTYAFYECSSLTEMTILATTPPTIDNINAISNATTTIYVPAGSKTAYETADVWKDLLTRDNPVTFVEIVDGSINVEGSIDTEDTTISGGVEIGGGAIIGG